MTARLNWLRAAVLGANDGVVSTAGLVVGVAGATSSGRAVLTAGFAGLVAGAMSMALGEYVSVSSQRDSEVAQLGREREALQAHPDEELAELTLLYQAKGLPESTAREVAELVTAQDALRAHAETELHLDPEGLSNPWHAAAASATAFAVGALLPLAAMVLSTPSARVTVTFGTVLVALGATGALSARLGQSPTLVAVARVTLGGAMGLGVAYAVGLAFGNATGG